MIIRAKWTNEILCSGWLIWFSCLDGSPWRDYNGKIVPMTIDGATRIKFISRATNGGIKTNNAWF
jgi:hypothetical protein